MVTFSYYKDLLLSGISSSYELYKVSNHVKPSLDCVSSSVASLPDSRIGLRLSAPDLAKVTLLMQNKASAKSLEDRQSGGRPALRCRFSEHPPRQAVFPGHIRGQEMAKRCKLGHQFGTSNSGP